VGYSDPAVQREYQRLWMAARRKEWFDANGPCIDCGSWDKLHADHVVKEDKVTHRVWSWTKKRRDEELAKCVVRCAGCHMRRHFGIDHPHGHPQRYRKGCKCDLCRAAHAKTKLDQKRRRDARKASELPGVVELAVTPVSSAGAERRERSSRSTGTEAA